MASSGIIYSGTRASVGDGDILLDNLWGTSFTLSAFSDNSAFSVSGARSDNKDSSLITLNESDSGANIINTSTGTATVNLPSGNFTGVTFDILATRGSINIVPASGSVIFYSSGIVPSSGVASLSVSSGMVGLISTKNLNWVTNFEYGIVEGV